MIKKAASALESVRADKMRGIHLAIVVDNKDDPKPYHVKVKYPWLPGTDKTFFARIVSMMAGPDRGVYLLPEKDDQVLVVFEHGEIERPIIVGSLWNEKQPPPEVNGNGKNEIKVIKSKCGHRIIFDDTDGQEKLIVVDKSKKNKVVLDTKEKTVQIESSGDITFKASSGNLVFHGKNVKMTSKTGAIKAEATGMMTVATSGSINVKADATLTIGSKVTMQMAGASAKGGLGGSAGGGQAGNKPKDQVKDTPAGGGGGGGGGGGVGDGVGGGVGAGVGGAVVTLPPAAAAPNGDAAAYAATSRPDAAPHIAHSASAAASIQRDIVIVRARVRVVVCAEAAREV